MHPTPTPTTGIRRVRDNTTTIMNVSLLDDIPLSVELGSGGGGGGGGRGGIRGERGAYIYMYMYTCIQHVHIHACRCKQGNTYTHSSYV